MGAIKCFVIVGITALAVANFGSPLWAATPSAFSAVEPLSGYHQRPWSQSVVRLDVRGYTEKEYFLSGKVGTTQQPYRTRLLVRVPTDPRKFNGVVIVEWLNVSAGFDLDIVGATKADLVYRDGYANV